MNTNKVHILTTSDGRTIKVTEWKTFNNLESGETIVNIFGVLLDNEEKEAHDHIENLIDLRDKNGE